QEIFICSCGLFDLNGGEFQKNFHDGSPHAGDVETSMMMHLAPGLVVPERFKPTPCNRECIPSLASVQWVRPWHLLMPQSYAGTPEVSTVEKGEAFIKACTKGLANLLIELSREPWHPCFPYAPAPKDD